MHKDYGLVSVVIPTYNRATVVCDAIDSVIAQTYKDTEIIVVDDGSSDNTKKILMKYSDRIRYFYKENGGASSARNLAIRNARGSFLAFLDSDDTWHANKLEKQMGALNGHDGFSTAISDVEFVANDGDVSRTHLRDIIKKDGDIFEYLLDMPKVTASYMLIKKSVFDDVGLFDDNLSTAEDIDLMLRIASKNNIILVDEPLVTYKKSDDSLSNLIATGNRLAVIDKIDTYAADKARIFHPKLRLLKARICCSYAEDMLWHGHIMEAQRETVKSIHYQLTQKALGLYVKSIIMRVVNLFGKHRRR